VRVKFPFFFVFVPFEKQKEREGKRREDERDDDDNDNKERARFPFSLFLSFFFLNSFFLWYNGNNWNAARAEGLVGFGGRKDEEKEQRKERTKEERNERKNPTLSLLPLFLYPSTGFSIRSSTVWPFLTSQGFQAAILGISASSSSHWRSRES